MLQIKLLHADAKAPKRQTAGSAGYDIYSVEAVTIPARQKKIIRTGISIQLPECQIPNHIYAVKLISRSGLSAKHNAEVGAGLIDLDYRGEVGVILYNHGDHELEVAVGDRIAQAIILPVATFDVEIVSDLTRTDRGVGGFGSTGMQ